MPRYAWVLVHVLLPGKGRTRSAFAYMLVLVSLQGWCGSKAARTCKPGSCWGNAGLHIQAATSGRQLQHQAAPSC